MDLKYIFAEEAVFYVNSTNRTANGSGLIEIKVTRDFVENNPYVALPYLIVLATLTVVGCIGNILVIIAVLTNKVSFLSVIVLLIYVNSSSNCY